MPTNEELAELKKKWIVELTEASKVRGWMIMSNDAKELLSILNVPQNPFTKDELDAHFWMLEHRSMDKDIFIKGVPSKIMEDFYRFEKKAKKLRDSL